MAERGPLKSCAGRTDGVRSAESARGTRFRLEPADPFDLIRWLARTQSDPRKAVAELVQNSIDAGARTITVERRRLRGRPGLVLRDDGDGVLPDRGREEALRYIGTHIGHSHKLGLSPSERHERVVAGQYGVGLLGFWTLGRRMELRSRVAGSEMHVLTLVEDDPAATLSRVPAPLDCPATVTEVVIFELHEPALRPLVGRRLADYLGAELRGAIAQSGVSVEIHDRLARGLAQKRFVVEPRRFGGVRLELPTEVGVAGHAPARVELYLARGADRPAIQVACSGTLVAEDIAELAVLGFTEAPWSGCDVTGIIDFAGFQVPPGTRRGVVPNAAAAAFARAMGELEPALLAELARLERERRAASDRHVVDELRRAMRGLRERLPHYDLPDVEAGVRPASPVPVGTPSGAGAPADAPADAAGVDGAGEPPGEGAQAALFAPGPLAVAAIVPRRIAVPAGGERRLLARALDADGASVATELRFEWSIDHPGFVVRGEGARPAVASAGRTLVGAEGTVEVIVRSGPRAARATATVVLVPAVDRMGRRGGEGIPHPELVDAPGAPWRSRMDGRTWQVNVGHEDYVSLGEGRGRLRYLVALLGKEIVARTYAQPRAAELLEHLVAVLAHAERNLRRAE